MEVNLSNWLLSHKKKLVCCPMLTCLLLTLRPFIGFKVFCCWLTAGELHKLHQKPLASSQLSSPSDDVTAQLRFAWDQHINPCTQNIDTRGSCRPLVVWRHQTTSFSTWCDTCFRDKTDTRTKTASCSFAENHTNKKEALNLESAVQSCLRRHVTVRTMWHVTQSGPALDHSRVPTILPAHPAIGIIHVYEYGYTVQMKPPAYFYSGSINFKCRVFIYFLFIES